MKILRILACLFIFIYVTNSYAEDAVKKDSKTEMATRKIEGKKDAIEVAKEYLKKKNILLDYHLTKYLAKLDGNAWHVVFLKKKKEERSLEVQSIRIKIDKNTGQVAEHVEQGGFYIDKASR